MPWQQQVADVALEVDPATGLLWYREVVVTVPRQSGKTTLLKGVQSHRCVAWPRQRVTYTAQTRNAARKKWADDFVIDLEASPLGALFETRLANGQEAMRWRNGSSWGIEATTESSGHGDVLDLGVIDEAFKQTDHRLEQAMRPAMMTRPQPQLWIISTAGNADSVYLWGKVEAGRQIVELGDPNARVAYFEWSAGDDDDPADPDTWWRCMPALGITVPVEAILADFQSMALAEFERAYLNRWSAGRREPVFSPADWSATLDSSSRPNEDELAYALDVTPDRGAGSIAASDGRHLEVVRNDRGTGWLVERAREVTERRPGEVVVDPAGPAGSLIPELEAAGVVVRSITGREYAQACGQLFDAVVAHEVRHIGQNELDTALQAATRRRRGDVWTWARNDTTTDLSPLVAVTLARWAAANPPSSSSKAGPVFAW